MGKVLKRHTDIDFLKYIDDIDKKKGEKYGFDQDN